jgi:putative ABC transport system permease protein
MIVLGVALGNLLNLMLVRAHERRAEMAVRIAMGASRRQLMRQLMIEAFVLTSVSGGLGCAFAVWATRLAVAWAPPSIPRLDV